MDIDKLAEKLDRVLDDYDPYGYMDCEYSVEQARSDLAEMPLDIIDHLLNIITDLMETN